MDGAFIVWLWPYVGTVDDSGVYRLPYFDSDDAITLIMLCFFLPLFLSSYLSPSLFSLAEDYRRYESCPRIKVCIWSCIALVSSKDLSKASAVEYLLLAEQKDPLP